MPSSFVKESISAEKQIPCNVVEHFYAQRDVFDSAKEDSKKPKVLSSYARELIWEGKTIPRTVEEHSYARRNDPVFVGAKSDKQDILLAQTAKRQKEQKMHPNLNLAPNDDLA